MRRWCSTKKEEEEGWAPGLFFLSWSLQNYNNRLVITIIMMMIITIHIMLCRNFRFVWILLCIIH